MPRPQRRGSSSSASAFRSALKGRPSFSTKTPAIAFTKSDTYAGELRRLFPPPADQQWIGYISAVGDYDPKGTRLLAMEPEFTLPASATGTPFRWRTVVGFREGGDAAAPVSCPQPDPNVANRCIESPADTRIRTDEVNAVSDFDVLGGATTTAFPGTTAVVPFKLLYADAAKLGKQSFSLSARTALPRTGARIAAQLPATPDGTTPVEAQVPVPLNTPAGRYAVAVTGAIGSPAVTRSATGTIVVEPLPPQTNKPLPAAGQGRLHLSQGDGWKEGRSPDGHEGAGQGGGHRQVPRARLRVQVQDRQGAPHGEPGQAVPRSDAAADHGHHDRHRGTEPDRQGDQLHDPQGQDGREEALPASAGEEDVAVRVSGSTSSAATRHVRSG